MQAAMYFGHPARIYPGKYPGNASFEYPARMFSQRDSTTFSAFAIVASAEVFWQIKFGHPP